MPSPARGEGAITSAEAGCYLYGVVPVLEAVRRPRRGWGRGIEVDEALTVADLGLEGLERDEAGRLRGLAARHMEFAEMEGALDLLAVDRSVGEVGHAVGAARLGGVVGPVDVVDGDELVADLAADHAIHGNIGGGTNLNGRHMLSALTAQWAATRALAAWPKSARGREARVPE